MPKRESRRPAKQAPAKSEPIAPRTATGKRAQATVQQLGLPEPGPPSTAHRKVEFPQDLTSIGSTDLGMQMSVWVGMLNYAHYQKTLIENDNVARKSEIARFVGDRIDKVSADSVTEKKAIVHRDPHVRKLAEELEHGEAAYNLLRSLCDSFERNYAAVSREISRRGIPAE